jgi:outer membrane protein OmpA-like peptidoglycan-associated protein
LTILDSKGKKVFVYKTENPGKYLARMNKNEPYSYLISSGNYEENIASLSNEGGNIQNLFLKKKGVKQLAIEFIDEVTKEVILPDYKVGLNGKPVTVVNDNLVLDPDATYSLRALLKNYKSLKIDQLEKLAKGAKVTLEMTRETYPVKIYVKNFESLAELKKIKLSIFTTKNVSVLNRLDDRGNFFETFVQADGSYKLTAMTEGYEIFTKDFQLTELVKENAKDITLTIVLKENNKPEVVVKEIPKIEADPIIEAPKPVVINKPELEEKVVLNSVPSNVASLEKELTDKNSIGKRYFLDQVNFNQSSPKITDEIVKQLDNIAKVLQDKPQVKIEIVGHTDNVGDPRANLGLSRFRAKAVGNYLFNKGADPDRIIVIGKGEEEPVASNDTEENRAKNRRVEMILIEN